MKKILLCMAVLLAFAGVAMADQTTATSTTTLNVTVIAPVTLSCDSSISWNVLKAASGSTTSSGHLVTCNTGGGASGVSGVTDQLLEWQVTDLTFGSGETLKTLPATAIAVSADNTSFVAASAASTYAQVSDDQSSATLPGSYTFYVNATVPSGQAAAAYTGTMTTRLTVTYTP